MNGKTTLKRLERLAQRRTQTRDGWPVVRVIEIYCDGELLEVMPLYGGPGETSANAELSQAIPSSSASK